ncbi:acetolactate synthase small subunit [Lutimonas zeaxanthinifaciens]|uniref:acetolactate synthase small subunit n=1 Tax=Lutimonas zeaxanthinifaciens TaxID=3060215 RepID=UPI00265D2423|nr:acetolactate synthase small subunit [Lutimonas sp. YSD2104]WKK65405.1 acetolactate synthase small subunit [Lutimonas sp. YSD2104]
MKVKKYTISVYSENNLGLLNKIATIFLKRHINIESLTVSSSEIEHVSRFIIVVEVTEEQVKKIIGQIEKQVEVIKAYYHTNEECIFLQSALFKIKSSLLFEERQIQNIIKNSNAQIVTVSPEFFVIEKSGRREEIDGLYNELAEYGIMQFVRSGRISVTKDEMKISELLKKQLN